MTQLLLCQIVIAEVLSNVIEKLGTSLLGEAKP